MFGDWFRRPTRHEPLDLTRHKPTEFEVKSVSLDGRHYLIDGLFRQGSQGHAHLLIDQKTGSCQHIIQIRMEYMRAPAAALAASLQKAELTAGLRERMGEKAPIIPAITVRREHGGSFELHTFPSPLRPEAFLKWANSSVPKSSVPSTEITSKLQSDGSGSQGRSDFYVRVFQHHALREAAFQMHPKLLKGFNSGDNLQLISGLRHIWLKVPLKLGAKAGLGATDEYIRNIAYERREIGKFTVHILSMPKPLHRTEASYIAIACLNTEPPAYPEYSRSTRYFTLELNRDENFVFCEWTIERHLNYGIIEYANLEAFVNKVTGFLCGDTGHPVGSWGTNRG